MLSRAGRSVLLQTQMRYLENPSYFEEKEIETFHGLFDVPSRTAVINMAETIFRRLYPSEVENHEATDDHEKNDYNIYSTPPKASLKNYLEKSVEN